MLFLLFKLDTLHVGVTFVSYSRNNIYFLCGKQLLELGFKNSNNSERYTLPATLVDLIQGHWQL